MGTGKLKIVLLLALAIFSLAVNADENYNDAKNRYMKVRQASDEDSFTLHMRPFRIAKLNYIWDKAMHHLPDTKMQSLFMDLKLHDKEELDYKLMKEKDKTKEKELELRNKLIRIMLSYDLFDHFDDANDKEKTTKFKKTLEPEERLVHKSLFKDKRLGALWEKAQVSGFTKEELDALKVEFDYHEERVESYYNLLNSVGEFNVNKHENAVNEDEHESYNVVSNDPNDNHIDNHQDTLKKYETDINTLREHHRGIKTHFDRLERMVASGPDSQDFIEPKVQGLWRVALVSNFTESELDSLRTELHNFQTRLLKLRNLHVEHKIQQEKYKNVKENDKKDRLEDMEQHIKKQQRKVEKLQEGIEKTIFKHTEL